MHPRVRTNALTGYVPLARSMGVDPAALVAAAGLDIADVEVADRWLPAAPVARLLEATAGATDCEHFGLALADLRQLGTLGPLGVVLREEPDLRSVLDLLVRYERVYTEALDLTFEETEEHASLVVGIELGEPVPHAQALDLTLGAFVGIIRALVDPGWTPVSASFSRPAPEDPLPWRRLFGATVVFDQPTTRLRIRAADLAAPVVASDPSLRPYTQEYLTSVLARPAAGDPTELDQVAEALEVLLPLGRHSIRNLSRHLGTRPRVLQRSLAEQGHTYSAVVHATRARLAEQYLSNERYSLTELSQVLGFEAPSAFSRWFRQQFGTSPTEWRRTLHAGPDPGTGRGADPVVPPPRGGELGD